MNNSYNVIGVNLETNCSGNDYMMCLKYVTINSIDSIIITYLNVLHFLWARKKRSRTKKSDILFEYKILLLIVSFKREMIIFHANIWNVRKLFIYIISFRHKFLSYCFLPIFFYDAILANDCLFSQDKDFLELDLITLKKMVWLKSFKTKYKT